MKKIRNLTKIIAIGLMVTSFSVGVIGCGNSKTAETTKEQTATDTEYTYEILDENVELSDEIKSWRDEQIGKDGVFTKSADDFTYAIICGGSYDKNGYGIGLINIDVANKVDIKYEIVEPQESTQPTSESNEVETVTIGEDGKMDVVQIPQDQTADVQGTVPEGTNKPYMLIRVKGTDVEVTSEKVKAEDFFNEQAKNEEIKEDKEEENKKEVKDSFEEDTSQITSDIESKSNK